MQTATIAFPRLGYSFAELEVLIGLSRSTLHRMVARGEIETVKRGRRRLVPADQVQRLCGMSDGAGDAAPLADVLADDSGNQLTDNSGNLLTE
jgi:excisionase family DNA binding protein